MFAWIHSKLTAEAPSDTAGLPPFSGDTGTAAARLQAALRGHLAWIQTETTVRPVAAATTSCGCTGCPLSLWIDGPGRALCGDSSLLREFAEAHTHSHARSPRGPRWLVSLLSDHERRHQDALQRVRALSADLIALLTSARAPRLVRG